MKIFGLKIERDKGDQYEKYMQEIFRYLNYNIPVPIGDNPTNYIKQGYAYNPLVYAIISLRANAAKSIPWLVYRVKNQSKMRDIRAMTKKWGDPIAMHRLQEVKSDNLEEVSDTPLNELFERPNKNDTFQDLVEKTFIYRDTTGNSYIYLISNEVTKKVISMLPLPADHVKIIGGDIMTPVKGYVVNTLMNRDTLEPQNVLHWKYPNPLFMPDGRWLYGMSPLRAAAAIIMQENMAIQGQTAAFLNEGLKGIITGTEQTNIEFTPEQAKQVRDNFKKQSGYKNKNNIAFNRAPLSFVKIGESPVDLGVMEARAANKEILCNIFRIHPSLLSSDASTLNNLTEARRALMTMSVLPDIESLKAHLNERVAKSFGPEWYVDYDQMAIPELQEDSETLARTLQAMDWVTTNEKRSATAYDRYENEGADKLYQPFGLTEMGEDIDTGFDEIDKNLNR